MVLLQLLSRYRTQMRIRPPDVMRRRLHHLAFPQARGRYKDLVRYHLQKKGKRVSECLSEEDSAEFTVVNVRL